MEIINKIRYRFYEKPLNQVKCDELKKWGVKKIA
jgi:hypothetical protein